MRSTQVDHKIVIFTGFFTPNLVDWTQSYVSYMREMRAERWQGRVGPTRMAV